MKLREFGRNVQMMLNYCKKLEDRDERNALARSIVRIMANINPISYRRGRLPAKALGPPDAPCRLRSSALFLLNIPVPQRARSTRPDAIPHPSFAFPQYAITWSYRLSAWQNKDEKYVTPDPQ